MGELQSIGGNANFINSKITNLGKLKTIGKSANFFGANITDFGNLKYIGGDVGINEKLTSKNLEGIQVNGNIIFEDISDNTVRCCDNKNAKTDIALNNEKLYKSQTTRLKFLSNIINIIEQFFN